MGKRPTPKHFKPTNPQKYKGDYPIVSRSSWEWDFMVHCDTHPDVVEWASEPHRIPYRDPITNKQKIYIPDFLVTWITKSRKAVSKLIEIKPMHEQLSEHAKSRGDAAIQARNRAKWGAAISWASRRGIEFEVMNESNLYVGHDNRKGRSNPIREYAPSQGLPSKKVRSKKPATRKSSSSKSSGKSLNRRFISKTSRVGKISKTRRVKRA